MRWMEEAIVIVMYARTTHWVGWELKQIIEGGLTEKLILLFPLRADVYRFGGRPLAAHGPW